MIDDSATGRRIRAADLLEHLRQGEPIQLTNRPEHAVFNFMDIDIAISPAAPGQYRFETHLIANDGSCAQGHVDETLDDDKAYERLAELLTESYGNGQPVYRRVRPPQ